MRRQPPLSVIDFQNVFIKSPVPCSLLSPELVSLACNEAYEKNANRLQCDMLSRPVFDIFPGQKANQREELERSFSYVLANREAHQIPLLHYPISAIGGEHEEYLDRYWTIVNIPILDNDGHVRFILHCPSDITELTLLRRTSHTQAQEKMPNAQRGADALEARWTRDVQTILSAERERLHQLFQQAPGFICVLRGPQHVFELANDAYYQLIGHRQILGQVLAEVLPEVIVQGYLARLDRVFAMGEPFIGRALPIQLQRAVGGALEQRYIDLIYQPMLNSAGRVSGIFVQGHDVTEAHELACEISYQAAHDPLTGLYNRREFANRTVDLDSACGPHAMLCMDLDHFKSVNDRCGHAAGDALLLQVANVLKQHVGDHDVLARLGGDEFALTLRGCSEFEALERAENLRRNVGEIPFFGMRAAMA